MTSRLEPRPLATGTRLANSVADSVPVYHNSGPTPNNAYRTGAVGVQVDISGVFIVSGLLKAAKLTHLVAACVTGGFGARLHPVLIHAAACSALVQLNASAAITRSCNAVIKALARTGPPQDEPATREMVDSAMASIAMLRDVLRDQQLLPPFHGLVSCASYDYVKQHKPLPWLSCSADDRIAPLAWGLVAIACASPPILLFNRQPSLMWFRQSHSLMVRWFGAAAPAVSATTAATGASR
jgi:hypothetical protein